MVDPPLPRRNSPAVITLGESADRLREQIAEIEADLGNRKQLLINTEAMLNDSRKDRTKVIGEVDAIEGDIEKAKARFDENTRGLRKDIEKATRRRDHAHAMFRDLLAPAELAEGGGADAA